MENKPRRVYQFSCGHCLKDFEDKVNGKWGPSSCPYCRKEFFSHPDNAERYRVALRKGAPFEEIHGQ